MIIRTQRDFYELSQALNACKGTVWLAFPGSEFYNMKDQKEYALGMARLRKYKGDAMELYTSCETDAKLMTEFYFAHREVA